MLSHKFSPFLLNFYWYWYLLVFSLIFVVFTFDIFVDIDIFILGYNKYHIFIPTHHMPSNDLTFLSSHWSFIQWRLDFLGPLPMASGKRIFMLVAIYYFSKWVENEAFPSFKDSDVAQFVWKYIICHFGLPRVLIVNNDSQFTNAKFKDFCKE